MTKEKLRARFEAKFKTELSRDLTVLFDWMWEKLTKQVRKELLEKIKANTICLNCGTDKESNMTDWCDKCLETE